MIAKSNCEAHTPFRGVSLFLLIMIEIKDKNGKLKLSTVIGEGSIRRCTLMKEDYVTLVFSTDEPVYFKLGDGIDNEWGMFELVDLYSPTYNESTGGYDYQLRLDAYYWKWKNKIFKYTPENHGQEASWSLTATLDVHLGVFLRNLQALGYKYRNTPFSFEIGNTVENTSQLITYENTNLIDALNMMAETWDCEWWVTDSVIHFGKCEYGDPVKLELGVEVETMTREGNNQKFATRIYAFGSTNNIPSDYRPVDESVVVNGVVQKRLMLPEGTPYLDAYENMTQEEAVEDVVIFDDVYPRRIGTLSGITTQEYTGTIENEDGTTTEEKWVAYRFKDTGINFSKEYILPGQELQITFQSGKLNGMTFGVIFNPTLEGEEEKPEKLPDGSWNPEAQLWEIVRNEDYGRPLPGGELIPANGDTYYLTGFNIKLVSDQYISAAEEELKEKAQKYLDKTKTDPNTYNCTLRPDYVYNKDMEEEVVLRTFELGDKINLVNPTFFSNGRVSRVIGYERKLDLPYDHPVYFVGEVASTSRIGELEDKVDALTYKGQTFTGNGSGVYVVGRYDSTPLSDRNVLSSLKAISTFLRKDMADSMPYLLTLLAGAYFGKYIEGQSGGKINSQGIAELLKMVLRSDLQSDDFTLGALGSGYGLIKKDSTGKSYLEIDKVLVRLKAVFNELEIRKLSYSGGNFIFSPAGMDCTSVEEHDTFYRCFFTADDGEEAVENLFQVDDLVQTREFNIKTGVYENVSNRYFWRRCIAIGTNYIDLSKTDRDQTSDDAPKAGDSLVTIGNKTKPDRQNAIVISVYGEGSPSFVQYNGIDDYTMSGKEGTRISPGNNRFTGDFVIEGGESVSTVINGVKSDLEETKTEFQGKIDTVDSKVEGIQIGVRNLLLKSNVELSGHSTYQVGRYTYHTNDKYALKKGKIYTLVLCYTLGENNTHINAYWRGGSNAPMSHRFQTRGDRVIESFTQEFNGDDTANTYLPFYQYPEGTYGSKVHWAVLVEGNKAPNMWVAAPEDIQAEVEAAQQAASEAQEAATAAQSDATEAKNELNQINSDSVISPVEKTALKQQQADIQAEYNEIIADAGRYSISTTAYKNAYTSANNALTKYTATSPTYITVGSDYANIAAYYDARQTILNSIAAAAKQASDDAMQAAEDEAELAKWRAIGYSWNSGKPLWTDDPTFKEGVNRLIVYGSSTITREVKQEDSPINDSEYNLKIVSKGGIGYGLGGFSRPLSTRANAIFVLRLIAKIPEGYNIESPYNEFGDVASRGYVHVTSNVGTGRFEEYIIVFKCGVSGPFSTIGYFSIVEKGSSAPCTWYLAYAGAFDVTAGVSTGEQLQTVSGTVTTLSSELTNTKEAFESYKGEVESKFTAAATATEDQIENAVLNLQKGMRNLVLNGKVDIEGSTSYNVHNFDLSKDLVVGNKYTLITKAKPTSNQQYCFYDSAAQNRLLTFLLGDFTNGVACKTFTYNPHSAVTNHARIRIYNYPSSSSAANPLDVEWVCLYEGDIVDKVPDYFVNAPEDLNLEINSVKQSVSAIEQTAENISLRVTTTETKVTTAQNTADAAQTAANNASAKADTNLTAAKDYADDKKQEAINTAAADATSKANDALADAKADATTKANNALASAKTDAQNKADAALSSAKSYADTKDSSTLESAKNYAESEAAGALSDAKDYTDGRTKPMWKGWIDATGLDEDKYYPVTITISSQWKATIEVYQSLNYNCKPLWSTHNGGFSLKCIWEVIGSGWGVNPNLGRQVLDYSKGFTAEETVTIDGESVTRAVHPVGTISQIGQASMEYIYVRGGGQYYFTVTNANESTVPALRTSDYTWTSGSTSVTLKVLTPAEIKVIEITGVTKTELTAEIEILDGKISQRVTKTDYDANNVALNNQIGQLETSYDSISGTVSSLNTRLGVLEESGFIVQDDFVTLFSQQLSESGAEIASAINITPNGITLQSEKVEFVSNDGAMKFFGKDLYEPLNVDFDNLAGVGIDIDAIAGGATEVINVNNVFKVSSRGDFFFGVKNGNCIEYYAGGRLQNSAGVGSDIPAQFIINVDTLNIRGGSINFNNGVFKVDSNGAMTATEANITGTVDATYLNATQGGIIGGFTISENYLTGSKFRLSGGQLRFQYDGHEVYLGGHPIQAPSSGGTGVILGSFVTDGGSESFGLHDDIALYAAAKVDRDVNFALWTNGYVRMQNLIGGTTDGMASTYKKVGMIMADTGQNSAGWCMLRVYRG